MVKFNVGDKAIYTHQSGNYEVYILGWNSNGLMRDTIYRVKGGKRDEFLCTEDTLTPIDTNTSFEISLPEGFTVNEKPFKTECGCLCTWEGIVHKEDCSMYERVGYQPWPIQQQKVETKEEINQKHRTSLDIHNTVWSPK